MKEHAKNLSSRMAWLIIISVLIVLYGLIFWYVKTQLEKASYALSRAEISYEQRDKIRATAATVKDLETQVAKIDSYFVGADDVVGFINLLEQKARDLGVSVETTNVVIEETIEEVIYGEELEVSILIKGDWNEVMQYIRLIENLPYNIWIIGTNLSLEKSRTGEDNEEELFHWEADVTLRVLKHN